MLSCSFFPSEITNSPCQTVKETFLISLACVWTIGRECRHFFCAKIAGRLKDAVLDSLYLSGHCSLRCAGWTRRPLCDGPFAKQVVFEAGHINIYKLESNWRWLLECGHIPRSCVVIYDLWVLLCTFYKWTASRSRRAFRGLFLFADGFLNDELLQDETVRIQRRSDDAEEDGQEDETVQRSENDDAEIHAEVEDLKDFGLGECEH